MNQENFATFSAAYRVGLLDAVTAKPEDYALGRDESPAHYADRVARTMLAKMAEKPGMLNYDGGGFRRACKALGIKHTRKAIFAYLEIGP